jgi:hypothetical protein
MPCSANVLTLKMKAICSSETSVDTQRKRRYIPEDCTLRLLRYSQEPANGLHPEPGEYGIKLN